LRREGSFLSVRVSLWQAARSRKAQNRSPRMGPDQNGHGWSGEGARDGIAMLLQLADPRQQLREARELTAQASLSQPWPCSPTPGPAGRHRPGPAASVARQKSSLCWATSAVKRPSRTAASAMPALARRSRSYQCRE